MHFNMLVSYNYYPFWVCVQICFCDELYLLLKTVVRKHSNNVIILNQGFVTSEKRKENTITIHAKKILSV